MSGAVYQIPLSPSPQQMTLTLAGVRYQFRFTYRTCGGMGWMLDISDNASNLIIGGIALVQGTNLLAQYSYFNFGGALYYLMANDPNAQPLFTDLGVNSQLYWVPA